MGIVAFQWIMEPAKQKQARHFQLTWEKIESGDKAAEAMQIDEIKSANDKYAEVLDDPAYMVENNIYAKDCASPDQVTITFAGDILFEETYAII